MCQFVTNDIHYVPIPSWGTLSISLFKLTYLSFQETLIILKVGLLHLFCKTFPSFFCGCCFLLRNIFTLSLLVKRVRVVSETNFLDQRFGMLLITFCALSATISTISLYIVSGWSTSVNASKRFFSSSWYCWPVSKFSITFDYSNHISFYPMVSAWIYWNESWNLHWQFCDLSLV